MLALLLACSAPSASLDEAACDPRALAPGEVRARQVPCSEELVAGGEGRVGDWLLENAYARYVIRGTYAALSQLGQDGGTIIDAARPGGPDLLLEYLPEADRSAIVAVNEAGEARLELPGVTYRLGADDGALAIEGTTTGFLHGLPAAMRTGATLGDGADAFFGLDGRVDGGGSGVPVTDVTRVAVAPEALWPDGTWVTEPVDADTVVVMAEARELYRAPVVEGVADVFVPPLAGLRAEREGCVYDGMTPRGCGWLTLRVADDAAEDIPALVTDGRGWAHPVPKGGGLVPVGPEPRHLWLWAGPRHSVAGLDVPGGDVARTVTLVREMESGGAVLAALAVEVAPDVGSLVPPIDAARGLAAEGVDFAVLLADDEVPTVAVDDHDAIVAVAGSRAADVVFSWPWSPNGKRPAHGAVPWDGLGALDLLAVSEGGQSAARLTVVDLNWVERAIIEADPLDWDPRPDAFWLLDLGSLATYLALLDDWLDIAPVGPRTWIGVEADRNLPAYEAGIVDGRTTAGNGPRLALARLPDGLVSVHLDAPRWMGLHTVTLWTSEGPVSRPVGGAGSWKWSVPSGVPWVVAVAEGGRARPDSMETAWAVSAPLWLERPREGLPR